MRPRTACSLQLQNEKGPCLDFQVIASTMKSALLPQVRGMTMLLRRRAQATKLRIWPSGAGPVRLSSEENLLTMAMAPAVLS